LALSLAALLLACSHSAMPLPSAMQQLDAADLRPRTLEGDVRIDCDVKDAEVFLDGVVQGQVRDFDGTEALLKTGDGVHRVEIRKPGYQTYVTDLVAGNTIVVISVHLQQM